MGYIWAQIANALDWYLVVKLGPIRAAHTSLYLL